MEVALVVVIGLAWAISPIIALVQVSRLRTQLRQMRERLDWLESRSSSAPAAIEEPARAAAPELAPPPPVASEVPPSFLPPPAASGYVPPPIASMPAGPSAELAEPAAPLPRRDASKLESQIGGVWLQNVGAVVLLLGVFFLILWGYTTGRFGPGWLVAAGIGLGLAFAWRGDRLSRTLPRLGYALIGVGTGIVYLSLYLGHFTLHVLPLALAFTLLALTSFLAIVAGLRYQVQTIAALGVVGAFLPQFLASWYRLEGFTLTPFALLGYLALVDVLVFALAARAGWSALDLSALVLTALTWSAAYPRGDWTLWATIALSALFTGLGLAPLPRLVRTEGRVRALDLAVIAGAPAALILTLASWLAISPRQPVAMLLFALAGLQLAAAMWVDSRRPERDLWQPLTGAATVFLTAGLQRLVGDENTAMVWCIEGVVLVVLGLGARGGWLRFWGYLVTALSAMVAFEGMSPFEASAGPMPFAGAGALRELVVIAGLIAGATILARARASLSATERWIPEAWTGIANLMLLVWLGRECDRLAHAIETPAGRWWRGVSLPAPAHGERQAELFAALAGFAWFAQAAALAALGGQKARGFLRGLAYGVGAIALIMALVALLQPDGWSNDLPPVFHTVGLLELASLALAIVVAWQMAARRGELRFEERYAPEVWTVGALLMLLAWSAREGDHVARALNGLGGVNGHYVVPPAREALARVRTLGAALTSAAWLAEAVALLAFGWVRNAPFLRWAGLALLGITLLKFAIYDLATVEVFWRFLIAIAAGAAMLAVSYAYQRRAKRS